MTVCCPLCGGPMPVDDLRIDVEDGLVGRRGRVVRLTRHEMAVFETLLRAKGRCLSMGLIEDAIYGLECDAPESSPIRVRICALRRKLAGLGFKITTHWGRGYSLTVEQAT